MSQGWQARVPILNRWRNPSETETLADDQGCRGKHMHGRGQNDPEVGGGDYVMLLFNESPIPKC